MLLRPRNGFRCMMQESGSFPSHHRPSDRLWQAEGETRDVGPFSHLDQWSVGGRKKYKSAGISGVPARVSGGRGEEREKSNGGVKTTSLDQAHGSYLDAR